MARRERLHNKDVVSISCGLLLCQRKFKFPNVKYAPLTYHNLSQTYIMGHNSSTVYSD